MERLNVLCALPAGWDGYRAQPVSFHNANFALRVLEWTCASELPAPSIVPGPNGDLQIEWHLESGDIELHIIAPNNVNAWRMTDRSSDDGEEVRLTNEFSLVARWIKELMEPAVASRSAAA